MQFRVETLESILSDKQNETEQSEDKNENKTPVKINEAAHLRISAKPPDLMPVYAGKVEKCSTR